MTIDPIVPILIAFFSFVYLFKVKIYPFVIAFLDDYIQSVKNKINGAEQLKENASLALKKAHTRNGEIAKEIRINQEASANKIDRLRAENEQYLKMLREKFDVSLKARLEAELAKHKDLLIEKLADQLIGKLTDRVTDSCSEVSTDYSPEDFRKLM